MDQYTENAFKDLLKEISDEISNLKTQKNNIEWILENSTSSNNYRSFKLPQLSIFRKTQEWKFSFMVYCKNKLKDKISIFIDSGKKTIAVFTLVKSANLSIAVEMIKEFLPFLLELKIAMRIEDSISFEISNHNISPIKSAASQKEIEEKKNFFLLFRDKNRYVVVLKNISDGNPIKFRLKELKLNPQYKDMFDFYDSKKEIEFPVYGYQYIHYAKK